MDWELAKRNPGAVFDSPEDLRDSPELTKPQKIELLKRWAYDAADASVALEEGMPAGPELSLELRVLEALGQLGAAPDVEHASPTKQHGLPNRRR